MSALVHEVLTLAEAAQYLRVAEDAVLKMAQERQLPARKIGEEWRFSAGGLQQWLRCDSAGENGAPLSRLPQPTGETLELLLAELERRLLPRLDPGKQPPLQGNKERLLALAGAWKDDPTLDEMLQEIYRRRGRSMTEEEE